MAQTAKQKANAVKFRAAIAYHKKNPGLTKKQAFAHVYGKRVLNGPAKPVKAKKRPSTPLKRQGAPATKKRPAAKPAVRVVKKTVTRKVSIGSARTPALPKATSLALVELTRYLKLLDSMKTGKLKLLAQAKTESNKAQKQLLISQANRYTNMIIDANAHIRNLKREIK